ncbi:MAG: archease [Methanosphaera stadtmanae]|nr:archease [Methanosphaera stadtmanae]
MNKNNNYEYFETTADIGITAYGETIEIAFINSALGTMNLITDINQIKPKISKSVEIKSEDIYGLLYDWITELLILLDSDFFIASQYDIKITKNKEYVLTGSITGDIYNTDNYNYKTEVKAITYHNMDIKKIGNKYKLNFILDL